MEKTRNGDPVYAELTPARRVVENLRIADTIRMLGARAPFGTWDPPDHYDDLRFWMVEAGIIQPAPPTHTGFVLTDAGYEMFADLRFKETRAETAKCMRDWIDSDGLGNCAEEQYA